MFTAARAVEGAVILRIQEQQAKASGKSEKHADDAEDTRLPWWGALSYLVLALGTVGLCLYGTSDLFPFALPCGNGKCSCRQGELLSCGHIRGTGAKADHAGITSIRSNAFDGVRNLYFLDLSGNGLGAADVSMLSNVETLGVLLFWNNTASCSDLSLPATAVCIDDERACDETKCATPQPGLPGEPGGCKVAPGEFAISNQRPLNELVEDAAYVRRSGGYVPPQLPDDTRLLDLDVGPHLACSDGFTPIPTVDAAPVNNNCACPPARPLSPAPVLPFDVISVSQLCAARFEIVGAHAFRAEIVKILPAP